MKSLWDDLRLSVRGLAHSPRFTVVALLTLALGIGANTGMFTVLNAVLLRALPVEKPQRLVILSNPEVHGIGVGDGSGTRGLYAYSEFEDLRDRNQVFSGLCAVDSHVRKTEVAVEENGRLGEAERANVSLVSGDYFHVLAIRSYLGRLFGAEVDKTPHANPVAVISHGYWQSRFALDPAVVGRKIRVNRAVFDIVAVAQPGFSGETVGFSTDIWVPLTMQNEVFPAWTDFLVRSRSPLQKILWLQMIGRLKPGVTLGEAQAGINLTARQVREGEAADLPAERRREYTESRIPLADRSRGANRLSDAVGDPLKMLMAIVGLVLLVACANVGTLALARGSARRREIAVRLAIGAGRRRVMQQLLVESVLLAVVGGALGLVLAQWIGAVLVGLVSSPADPIFLSLRPDARILAFTFGVSLVTGILFGLAPGLRAARLDLNAVLKAGSKGVAAGGRDGKLPAGRILVAAQIALSLSVLIVAGLFLRSFQNLVHVSPGFDYQHILTFDLGFLEASGYKGPEIHRVHEQTLQRLNGIPGVKGATLAFMGIFVGNDTGHQISLDGSTPGTDKEHLVRTDLVPANYFAAIGQKILLGREFGGADEAGSQDTGVINQTLARKFFGSSNPVGKRIWYDHDHPQSFEVVGVAADSKHNSLREPPAPEFWLPFFNAAGDEPSFCTFQVRYSGDPAPIVTAIRAAAKEVAPAVPLVDVRTMNELMGESLTAERAISRLAGGFGLLALVLASSGLYGVMSFNVAARTNEIGIRMAVGAQSYDILRIVLRETVMLVAIGMVFGLPSIWAAKRWVSSQLFGLTALDPAAIAGAALVLAVVAGLAGFVPARWASRVDPTVALHYDG